MRPAHSSARTSFGRHDPPKANPGVRYASRDVELPIQPEDAHHFLRVGAERVAQIGDLVREADLQGVKGVADVFDHLGGPHAVCDERSVDAGIEVPKRAPRVSGVVAADQNKRRMVEIVEARSLRA